VSRLSLRQEAAACVPITSALAAIGVYLTRDGRASSRYSRRGSRPRSGAIGRASRTARPWMPSSLSSVPGARGRPCMAPASVPVVRRIAVSKHGRRLAYCWSGGREGWGHPRPGRALTGSGWPWTARGPKRPSGGKQVGKHPTDRGKIGTQRRVLPDGGGGPLGLAVEGAKRNDVKMGGATRRSLPIARPTPPPAPPPGLGLDQGEDDDDVRELRADCGGPAPSRARGEEAKALTQEAGVRARRWVVERPPSGRNRVRRVLIRGDKKVRNEIALLPMACASMTDRQAGLLG
jgi:hypothetical protein